MKTDFFTRFVSRHWLLIFFCLGLMLGYIIGQISGGLQVLFICTHSIRGCI